MVRRRHGHTRPGALCIVWFRRGRGDAPRRRLRPDYPSVSHSHRATAVAEEHQRLACEIANLQTRKAILTAPIVRSGGVLEPSQEELLAQQHDRNGTPPAPPLPQTARVRVRPPPQRPGGDIIHYK